MDKTNPSPEELKERAGAMVAALASRVEAARTDKKIPAQTIADFQQAGFFKILQPKHYGGYEMDPRVFYDVQMKIAEGCMSSAWVYGVIAVHNFQLALFDERAQKEVWSEDSSILISSSYQPVGKVSVVEGGFKLSGRWSFSSGCQHCDWVFLGAFAPPIDNIPDMRTFLLPRKDYEIIENWDVLGLQGTGSHDILVEDVFVPAYRTHRAFDGARCDNPGNKVNTNPLYRLPWAQLFTRSVSTSALGAAQGALNAYLKITAKRVSTNTGKVSAQDKTAQNAIAETIGAIDRLKLVLHRNFEEMLAAVHAGEKISPKARIKYRYDSAIVVQTCIEVVDALLLECGGRGIYLNTPLPQYFLDLHAARAHVANDPTAIGAALGAINLGLPSSEHFF